MRSQQLSRPVHTDTLMNARFVAPHTVVAAVEGNRSDINYQSLRDNLHRLKGARERRWQAAPHG